MNKLPQNTNDFHGKVSRLWPYLAIAALIVISYLVLFHTDLLRMSPAQAQVNVGKVGEAVTEQVTGAAAEHNADLSQAEAATESGETPQASTPQTGTPAEGEAAPSIGEPIGESAQAGGEADAAAPPSAASYSISTEGIGGKKLIDLTNEEIRQGLLSLTDVGGSEQITNALMPIILRFKIMVSPPENYAQLPDSQLPWKSTSTRYSPFDPVGVRTSQPAGAGHAMPPFPPVVSTTPETTRPRITAQQVADAIKLKGVMGEAGDYLAILTLPTGEKIVKVGDEVGTLQDITFVVDEISLNSVRIRNVKKEDDKGVIQFVEEESIGVTEFSISS